MSFESAYLSSRGLGLAVKPIALLPRLGQLLLGLVVFRDLLDNLLDTSVHHAFRCDDPSSAIAGRAILDTPGPGSVRGMLRFLDNVVTGQGERPCVEVGRIRGRRRGEYRIDPLDLPLARRRGRTTERAVGGPGTGHAPARRMAVRVLRLERSICGLVVALLLIIQLHKRWPLAEAIDDRPATATTGHTSLKLPTAQVRVVCAIHSRRLRVWRAASSSASTAPWRRRSVARRAFPSSDSFAICPPDQSKFAPHMACVETGTPLLFGPVAKSIMSSRLPPRQRQTFLPNSCNRNHCVVESRDGVEQELLSE